MPEARYDLDLPHAPADCVGCPDIIDLVAEARAHATAVWINVSGQPKFTRYQSFKAGKLADDPDARAEFEGYRQVMSEIKTRGERCAALGGAIMCYATDGKPQVLCALRQDEIID